MEFASLDDLYGALDSISLDFKVVRTKDRFLNPTGDGYRDILLNIRMPNGHVTELQLHMRQVLRAEERGHDFQNEARGLEANANKAGRDLTAAEKDQFSILRDQVQVLYLKAFQDGL